jgi:tRNA G10  N-methylase Trm11
MTVATHPAPFSKRLYQTIASEITRSRIVLDPFAGIGRIHEIGEIAGVPTVGVEIEPEWARAHPRTICANSLNLPFADAIFDCIATSPVYGNRMSDHYRPKDSSHRRTYRTDLGRDLHPNNSGRLQWGEKYRDFHRQAWKESVRVLEPSGRFILNVSDHYRIGALQPVTAWHIEALEALGLRLTYHHKVRTQRYKEGSNRRLRADHESVLVFNF